MESVKNEIGYAIKDAGLSSVAKADKVCAALGLDGEEQDWVINMFTEDYVQHVQDVLMDRDHAPVAVAHALVLTAETKELFITEDDCVDEYIKYMREGNVQWFSPSILERQRDVTLPNMVAKQKDKRKKILAAFFEYESACREAFDYKKTISMRTLISQNKPRFKDLAEQRLAALQLNDRFNRADLEQKRPRSKSADRTMGLGALSDIGPLRPSDSISNVGQQSIVSAPPPFVVQQPPSGDQMALMQQQMAAMQAMISQMASISVRSPVPVPSSPIPPFVPQPSKPEIKSVVVPASPIQDPNPDEVRPPGTPNLSAAMENLNVHVIGEPGAAIPSKRGKNKNKNK